MIAKRFTVGYFDEPTDVDSYVECNGEYINPSECVAIIEKLQEENNNLRKLNIPINKIKDIVVDCQGRVIGVYYND